MLRPFGLSASDQIAWSWRTRVFCACLRVCFVFLIDWLCVLIFCVFDRFEGFKVRRKFLGAMGEESLTNRKREDEKQLTSSASDEQVAWWKIMIEMTHNVTKK